VRGIYTGNDSELSECHIMAFCVKCGAEIPEGAAFCPKCGTPVGAAARVEKRDHSGIGGTLILVGGILALIFSIAPFIFMGMWGRWTGWMGGMGPWMGNMPFNIARWMMGFIIAGAIISAVLGIVAIYAYQKVRAGKIKSGGTIAVVIGVLMLVTMNWVTGIITLVGGILCYTSE